MFAAADFAHEICATAKDRSAVSINPDPTHLFQCGYLPIFLASKPCHDHPPNQI
jgi:hypothetical protein